MNKHETIADIVEDIRDSVKQLDFDHPCMVEAGTLRKLAERIEAAVVKEQSKRSQREIGNAAKMREALEGVRDWLVVHNAYVDTEREIVKLNAALAEPPRNCDRFKSEYDYDKLHEAFVKHCDSCNCPMGCIHRRDTRCMLDTRCGSILKCFAKFVLAEAEGEAK